MTAAASTTRVRVGCDFSFAVPAPISAVFQVEPQDESRQRVLEQALTFVPEGKHSTYQDSFGNRCSRLNVPSGPFAVNYAATIEVPRTPDEVDLGACEASIDDIPSEVLLYLLPSAYCLSDLLVNEAWARFGHLAPGWGRVQAIVEAVHGHLIFDYLSSSPGYTAEHAFLAGRGVCRDFAHLAISFCRALNIPARYVFGYLPYIDLPNTGPADFAAWMEVWLDGRWWTFDPRNNRAVTGRVVIGRGRDATEVAMVTTFGAVELLDMTVLAEEVLAAP